MKYFTHLNRKIIRRRGKGSVYSLLMPLFLLDFCRLFAHILIGVILQSHYDRNFDGLYAHSHTNKFHVTDNFLTGKWQMLHLLNYTIFDRGLTFCLNVILKMVIELTNCSCHFYYCYYWYFKKINKKLQKNVYF